MKRIWLILGVAIVTIVIVAGWRFVAPKLDFYEHHMAFEVPEYSAPTKTVWLK